MLLVMGGLYFIESALSKPLFELWLITLCSG